MTAKKRGPIGDDPLDSVIQERPQTPEADAGEAKQADRLSLRIERDLLEELRNAVVALSGPPLFLTLSDVGREALAEKLEQLKRKHNKGRPFPERRSQLKTGRRIS